MAGASGIAQSRRLLVASALAALVCAYIPGAWIIVYPIRLFVTYVHETSHALATLLTGGAITQVIVEPGGSGLTLSRGGLPLIICPAGYLGAALLGGLLLLLMRPKLGSGTLVSLGVLILAATLLWGRDPFTIIAGLVLAGVLLGVGRLLPANGSDFAAAFLAIQLCLNSILDVRTLLWLTTATEAPNDAVNMAKLVGLPPLLWALLWSLASVSILIAALRAAWNGNRSR